MDISNMVMKAVQSRDLWAGAAVLATAISSPPASQGELSAAEFPERLVPITERQVEPPADAPRTEADLLRENKTLRANVDARRAELEAYDADLQARLGVLSAQQRALLIEGRLLNGDYRDFHEKLSKREAELAAQVKELEEEVKDLGEKVGNLHTESVELRDKVDTTLGESRVLGENLEKAEKRAASLEETIKAYISAIEAMRREAQRWRNKPGRHRFDDP